VLSGYTQIQLQTFNYEEPEETPQVVEIDVVDGQIIYQAIDRKEVETEDFVRLAEETRKKMLNSRSKIYFKQTAIKSTVASMLDEYHIKYIDLGTSLIVQKLEPKQIEELSKNFFFIKDILENITISDGGHNYVQFEPLQTILDSSGITDYGSIKYPNYSGGTSEQNRDIGIMQWETGCPDPNSKTLDTSRLTVSYEDNASEHARTVAYILQKSSNHAHVHCSYRESNLKPVESYSPAIYILNMSYGYNWSQDKKDYTEHDQRIDNLILDHKVAVFTITKNLDNDQFSKFTHERQNVTSPGRAYNAITVGKYNEYDDDGKVIPVVYGNPETGAEKPELIMHGWFELPSATGDKTIYRFGSSLSSPFIASGFGANLLSQYPILRYRPQLLKAYLMTMSQNVSAGKTPINDKEGAGMPFYENAFSTYWTAWKSSNINYFFNKVDSENIRYLVKARKFEKGKKYRVAISWLVDGDYAFKHKEMSMDFELEVYNGSEKYVALTNKSNFRLLEFTAQATGNYSIKIKRTAYKQGVIHLGLASTRIDREER
jgi:hypothetical protein